MNHSARYTAAIAALLFAAACGDNSPTDPGEPTVQFEISAPRPTVVNPFAATRRGHDLTLLGMLESSCSPFDAAGEAWHENDTLFILLTFTGHEACELSTDPVFYTAKVTAAGGSSRLRVIHDWPQSGEPPDTVFRAVFSAQ
jgi:hypothetical protein